MTEPTASREECVCVVCGVSTLKWRCAKVFCKGADVYVHDACAMKAFAIVKAFTIATKDGFIDP